MRKNIIIPLLVIAVMAVFLAIVLGNSNHPEVILTLSPAVSLFSDDANEIFVSSVAGKIDLNSGITMDGPTPVAIPEQINNIDFAVFNHIDEPILFSNQGFDLAVFRYDEIAKKWENLPLRYAPHSELTMLPPRLETEYSDVNNSWDILEDETTAWGYKQIRIYVSGKGQMTNKTYGAYLDVTISLP
jgi:hypothetical protein